MKSKRNVGLFGKFHGLLPKLKTDLPAIGFTPFTLDPREMVHPPGTVAVICTAAEIRPQENERGNKVQENLSRLLNSLQEDRIPVVFVSVANSGQAGNLVTSFGQLNVQDEALVRESGLPYTIIRAMSADDRPGHHHKIFWKQDFEGQQKGHLHPVPWEDLSQIIAQCINRPETLSKTFTVHSVAGEPASDWDLWFQGLKPDSKRAADRKSHIA